MDNEVGVVEADKLICGTSILKMSRCSFSTLLVPRSASLMGFPVKT
jgi:hypothetical protein